MQKLCIRLLIHAHLISTPFARRLSQRQMTAHTADVTKCLCHADVTLLR